VLVKPHLLPAIAILAVASALPASAQTWDDYIAKYRATDDPAKQITCLEAAIGAWNREGDENGYLAWTKKTLSDSYYGQAMPLITRFMDAAAANAPATDPVSEKALELLDKAILTYPTPYAEYYRAECLVHSGEAQGAVEQLRTAIASFPDVFYNYSGCASALYLLGRWAEGVEVCATGSRRAAAALAGDPGNAELRGEIAAMCGKRAQGLFEAGDHPGAVAAAEEGYAALPVSDNWELAWYGFLAACMQAHVDFGAGSYDRALTGYRLALAFRGRNREAARASERDGGWQQWLDLVDKRRKMGVVAPAYVHRCLCLYVAKVRTDYVTSDGEHISVDTSLSASQRRYARVARDVGARLVEALSNGRYALEFVDVDVDAAITELSRQPWTDRELRYPVHESIEPFEAFAGALRGRIADVDTVVLFWNGAGIATAAGGGALQFPLDRSGTISPTRGWITFPLAYIWDGYTPDRDWEQMGFLHELFHVMQVMSSVSPPSYIAEIHEYEQANRARIPQWTGTGELDYYRWRFSTSLAAAGWANLNFKERYPMPR
jgi:tetratricopeptide (TPR) repeat protein